MTAFIEQRGIRRCRGELSENGYWTTVGCANLWTSHPADWSTHECCLYHTSICLLLWVFWNTIGKWIRICK